MYFLFVSAAVKEKDNPNAKEQLKNTKSEKNLNSDLDGDLAKIVCRIHRDQAHELYNTVGFVYRGLPVWNNTAQQMAK